MLNENEHSVYPEDVLSGNGTLGKTGHERAVGVASRSSRARASEDGAAFDAQETGAADFVSRVT